MLMQPVKIKALRTSLHLFHRHIPSLDLDFMGQDIRLTMVKAIHAQRLKRDAQTLSLMRKQCCQRRFAGGRRRGEKDDQTLLVLRLIMPAAKQPMHALFQKRPREAGMDQKAIDVEIVRQTVAHSLFSSLSTRSKTRS